MRLIVCHAGLAGLMIFAGSVPWTVRAQEPEPDLPALLKSGNESNMKGDYESARQSFLKAWEFAQETPRDNPVRYDILRRLTAVRAAVGEFADADNYLQMAINWREQNFGLNDPRIADDLLVSVGLCRGMKDYSRARAVLGRVMAMHTGAFGPESSMVADDFSRMAQIYMQETNVPQAINSLNAALTIRGKSVSALDVSLVPDLDRLAGAYITTRDYPKAEATFRHALVIRETLIGKDDADLIAPVDGMAYAMFGQKKYEEAEQVYQRLISLWVKSVGEDHPMVAMALDKVATFYADQKKYDQANEAQERANAIRAHFFATGLSIAATEQTLEGNKNAAIALYRRALVAMDPPNPIYQELAADVAEIVKNLESPPKVTKAPPRKK